MNDTKAISWVESNMPTEAGEALARFTNVNARWQGAHWGDVLGVLLDCDAHIDITDVMVEDERLAHLGHLPAAVTITLLWAGVLQDMSDDVRIDNVAFIIAAHEQTL